MKLKLNNNQSFNTKDTPMKKLTILIAILLVVGFSTNAFAQTGTTSTAATIVTPIGISNAANMNFGNVAINASAGTVVLTPAGSRSSTGGVTLPATAGTVTAAAFAVTGSGNYTYTITLPGGPITLNAGPVTVGTFVSNPSGTGTLTAGAQTVTVGATLNLPAGTTAGSYTNAAGLAVTVNYN